MRVPDEVRKAVAFIGYEDKRNGAFAPKGTFFFLGRDPQPGENFSRTVFAVTARHVIEGMRRKAVEETVLRLNPRAEGADLIMHPIPLHNWFVHPTEENIDVAITEVGVTVAQDHKVIPMSLCATDAFFEQNEVELGSVCQRSLSPPLWQLKKYTDRSRW